MARTGKQPQEPSKTLDDILYVVELLEQKKKILDEREKELMEHEELIEAREKYLLSVLEELLKEEKLREVIIPRILLLLSSNEDFEFPPGEFENLAIPYLNSGKKGYC